MQKAKLKEPRHIFNVAALSKSRSARRYRANSGKTTIVAKRDRQVLDTLIIGPVFCASPVRLSDSVLRLRRDHGIEVETEFLESTQSDGAKCRYGYYVLADSVTPILEAA